MQARSARAPGGAVEGSAGHTIAQRWRGTVAHLLEVTPQVDTVPSSGLVLSAAVTTGATVALSPHRSWLAAPVAAVWASATARASDRFRRRPPGPPAPAPRDRAR